MRKNLTKNVSKSLSKNVSKSFVILTTCALMGAAHAQTTANAVVKAPGQQPMVMPLNVHMLPYGTVTIAEGTYFIANYEGTGISIYIQSPTPLRIATVEEMMRYQAEWLRITDAISKTSTSASIPAATVQGAQNVTLPASAYLAPASPATSLPSASSAFAAGAAAPTPAPAPASAPAAPVAAAASPAPAVAAMPGGAAPVTLAVPASRPMNTFPAQAAAVMPTTTPQATQAAQAATPAPVATFPAATQMFAPTPAPAAPVAAPAPAPVAAPTASTPFPVTAASALAAPAAPVAPSFPATAATAFAPAASPQVPQAAAALQAAYQASPPAVPFINAPVTLLPRYVRPSFTLRGNTIGYSLTNTSADRTVMIDPQSLRIYQGATPMSAEMTLRDSLTGQMTGTLYPRAMLTGTVTFKPKSKEPITMTWEVRDDQGRTHPITQRWSLE